MARTEVAPDKYSVQFRIGSGFLHTIDESVAASGLSRNSWIIDAAKRYLDREAPVPFKITAEELLSERVTLMVRVEALMLELMNEAAEDRGVSRTVWLLDACMSRLAENGQRKRK